MDDNKNLNEPRYLIEDEDGFLLSLTESQFKAYRSNAAAPELDDEMASAVYNNVADKLRNIMARNANDDISPDIADMLERATIYENPYADKAHPVEFPKPRIPKTYVKMARDKRFVKPIFVFTNVALICTLIVFVALFFNLKSSSSANITTLSIELSELTDELNLLKSSSAKTIESLESKYKALKTTYDKLYDKSQAYERHYRVYYNDLVFYQNNVAVVVQSGKRYHHYDCHHISGKSYWIYNVEAAEYRGYSPCLDCWEDGLYVSYAI